MSDAIKQDVLIMTGNLSLQDVLIMTGNLSLDAALALVVSQQNEIEALKDKYERLKATHIETAKESSLREADNQDLRAENEKLRAALKPFADIAKQTEHWSGPPASVPLYVIRAAAAALKETGDD